MTAKQTELLTVEDVRETLVFRITKSGSATAYAKSINISPAYLSDILSGKREPGEKVLSALGLVRLLRYGKAAQ